MLPVTRNQIQLALGRQLTQFRESENFNKLITLFMQEIQDLEEVNFDLLDDRSIFTAVGAQLDILGLIVGETRQGRGDDEYRAALLLRISINIADGTPNTILDITRTYTTAESTEIWEHYPAMFVVRTDGRDRINGTLKNLVEDIKPAGVKTVVVSDIQRREFIPAWEVRGQDVSQFQVVTNNVTENFQVVDAEGLENDFRVVFGQVNYYNSNTDRAILAWIEPVNFVLDNGDNLILSSGEPFLVVTTSVPTDISQQGLTIGGDQLTNNQGQQISVSNRAFTERGILSQVVTQDTTN